MILHPDAKPRLRPVEPFVEPDAGTVGVRDPSGLSGVALSLSEPALFILALLDGTNTLGRIQDLFRGRYGQPLSLETLVELVTRLEESLLLEGPRFDAHYQKLLDEYRAQPARPMHSAAALGLDSRPGEVFDGMLRSVAPAACHSRIVGLIAPHLDYPRGEPCYAAAYGALARQEPPERFVILGTNHFGLGGRSAVTATGLDFATPLGTARTDRAFLERLEEQCGDLRRHEFDHQGEHSVELQVCWLQHLYGADRVRIVPLLCPDPCGPTGTAPYDGAGVDLAEFGRVLAETMAADPGSTVVVAGADFSHVGGFFGDERELDQGFLEEVHHRDQEVLEQIESGAAADLRACIARDENTTRICSAGCMFTLMTALPDAAATVLRYHQAVQQSVQNCVTCAAVLFQQ